MRHTISVALALIGLLAGAGFATGKEVLQYFVSHGAIGVFAGSAITAVLVTIGCMVIMQIGSYFMADEHSAVFRHVAHPRVSWALDYSVIFTLFVMGVIMLAGGGANLEQQFGIPHWLGALLLAVVVYFSGLVDVSRVSNIIGSVTPLMIIVIIVAFIWAMFNLPETPLSQLNEQSATLDPILSPWWWAAINCAGMTLMCAVGMSLVIGGNFSSIRSVGAGGFIGGITIGVLLVINSVTIYFFQSDAAGKEIPMTAIVDQIHPVAGTIVAIVVLLMIYNTALADFYALSRRFTVGHEHRRLWVYALIIAVGYGLSLFGFGNLMDIVFPILGVLGLILFAVLLAWRIRWSTLVKGESERRDKIREFTRIYLSPTQRTTAEHREEALRELGESPAESEELLRSVFNEEKRGLSKTNPDGPLPGEDGWR